MVSVICKEQRLLHREGYTSNPAPGMDFVRQGDIPNSSKGAYSQRPRKSRNELLSCWQFKLKCTVLRP
jgi:hypothetical protein